VIHRPRDSFALLLLGLAPLPMALLACLCAAPLAGPGPGWPEPPCWNEADCAAEMAAEEAELDVLFSACEADWPS
jgi:hypothetical protein